MLSVANIATIGSRCYSPFVFLCYISLLDSQFNVYIPKKDVRMISEYIKESRNKTEIQLVAAI